MKKIAVKGLKDPNTKVREVMGEKILMSYGGGMGGSSSRKFSFEPIVKNKEGNLVVTYPSGETEEFNPSFMVSRCKVKILVIELKNRVVMKVVRPKEEYELVEDTTYSSRSDSNHIDQYEMGETI